MINKSLNINIIREHYPSNTVTVDILGVGHGAMITHEFLSPFYVAVITKQLLVHFEVITTLASTDHLLIIKPVGQKIIRHGLDIIEPYGENLVIVRTVRITD